MDRSPERHLAHGRVLRARGATLPPEGLPGTHILDSWTRCLDFGLDFTASAPIAVVEAADLERRRECAAFVRRLAQAELETLAQQIAGSNFLLAFADPGGVILDLYSDNRFAMSGSNAGIVVGSCWSESLCGTNGLGTALASEQSVSVSGLEHYYLKLGNISCTAAPVRDACGEVVGVLDASSYFESRQHHTQALVQMAATHMENSLLAHQMQKHWLLAVHPRAEFLGTLSAGLLAFDSVGQLCAANTRARQLLQGLQVEAGTPFDSLFDEPFDRVTARLHRSAEIRLRDALGSTLVVRTMSRPVSIRHAEHVAAAARPGQTPVGLKHTASAGIVAQDPAVLDAFRLAEAAVAMKVPILIQGETGTGKEVMARHAHQCSGRQGAFVAVNCGALPDELFEAELFGYAGGAYSGARREGSPGLITSADGGTLLLDEIRELPLSLQAALLRFLDDGMVRPVGSTATHHVDVQLLAATNAALEDEVLARRFRADLLYRLNTVRVEMPPLRQRQDFAAAVHSVLRTIDSRATIDDSAVDRLQAYAWPGNFRELRSVLTRALLATEGRQLRVGSIECQLPAALRASSSTLQQLASETVFREYEHTGHSVSQTSRNLGVSRTTVYRHLGVRRTR